MTNLYVLDTDWTDPQVLTAEDLTREVLQHDGFEFRIEKNNDNNFVLLHSNGSRNGSIGLGGFTRTGYTSSLKNIYSASDEIYEAVAADIANGKGAWENMGDGWSVKSVAEYIKTNTDYLAEEIDDELSSGSLKIIENTISVLKELLNK